MKKIALVTFYIILSLLIWAQTTSNCSGGTKSKFLEVNNVRALVSNKNILWFDGNNQPFYQVPKYDTIDTLPPKNLYFLGALWMGGFGEDGQIKVAASTYGQDGNEFYPGPIENETTGSQTCEAWDELFEVSSLEVEAFLNNGTISQNILRYPGKDNPHLTNEIGASLPEGEDYFPFFDVNMDGIYNPNDGDYPNISGDQSIHWILNDIGNIHEESGGLPLGVEIKCTAYAYDLASLDTITFYRFEVTNKSYENLNDYTFGFMADPCLGKFNDDFVGVDTSSNTAYVYNGDDNDEDASGYGTNIPITGITLLDAPYSVKENKSKLHSFLYYSGGNSVTSNPTSYLGYFNYLNSTWLNGQHLTHGTNGFNPNSELTDFMFPSNPNDASTNAWSECEAGNVPSDRRFVFSAKPISLAINQTVKYEFAVVTTFNVSYPCPDNAGLLDKVNEVQSFYDNTISPQFLTTNVAVESISKNTTQIFPNPLKDFVYIESQHDFVKAEVYNLQGRLVLSNLDIQDNQINLTDVKLTRGNYFLKLIDADANYVLNKIVLLK